MGLRLSELAFTARGRLPDKTTDFLFAVFQDRFVPSFYFHKILHMDLNADVVYERVRESDSCNPHL